MAQELFVLPQFEIFSEYVVASGAPEIYSKLNNHHGDAFGKCKITSAGARYRIARIRILDSSEHPQLQGITSLAIWGAQGPLKIKHAREGKTTLRGVAMLLVEAEELPLYIQRQLT